MNFSALRPCFIYHLWFTSDFRQVPRWNLLQISPFLVHCCFCRGNYHGLRHWNKFVYQIVMLQWIFLFLQIWSSFFFGRDSSIPSLVDLLASKIHAHLDMKPSVFLRVSPCLFFLLVLQSMAGAIGVSNFLRAFWMVALNSLSGFSSDHLCFSFSLALLAIPLQSSSQKWSGLDVACRFVSLSPGPHISVWRFYSSNKVNWVKPV